MTNSIRGNVHRPHGTLSHEAVEGLMFGSSGGEATPRNADRHGGDTSTTSNTSPEATAPLINGFPTDVLRVHVAHLRQIEIVWSASRPARGLGDVTTLPATTEGTNLAQVAGAQGHIYGSDGTPNPVHVPKGPQTGN